MFEQAVALDFRRANRTWTTAAGAGGELILVALAVIGPLVSPQGLPRMQTFVSLLAPPAFHSARPPQPVPETRAAAPRQAATQIRLGLLVAPTAVPAKPAIIDETPPATGDSGTPGIGVPGAFGDGHSGSLVNQILRGAYNPPLALTPAAAPPTAAAPEQRITRIKLGGRIQQSKLIRQVMPVYPPLARQARVAGVVELLAVIAADGSVKELKLLSGHPMLVRAALDAVRQWLYSPTLLNGDPVEVLAPISVTFRLE